MQNFDEFAGTPNTYSNNGISDIEPFARMASEEEFVSGLTKVSSKAENIPGGIVLHSKGNSSYVRTDTVHTLVVGPTGTGKSRSFIGPNLLYHARTGNPAVIFDPKAELLSISGHEFEKHGYSVKVIDLRHPRRGIRYNPFAEICKNLRSGDAEARERGELDLSEMLYSMIVDDSKGEDLYWSSNPWQFACGLTRELVFRLKGRDVTMPMLKDAGNLIATNENTLAYFENTLSEYNPNLSDLRNIISVSASNTRSGMMGYFNLGLSACKSSGMADLLSGNDLDLHSIARGDSVALFIISPDDSSIYDSLVSVIVNQIVHTLYFDADSLYGGSLPREVLFVLEEFANIPAIPSFEKLISTARSRRIRFLLSVQSISQILGRYGLNADTVISNCKDWVCTAGDNVLARKITERIGTNAAERPILTHNVLRNLPLGHPLVLADRGNPFIASMEPVGPGEEYRVPERPPLRNKKINLDDILFDKDL